MTSLIIVMLLMLLVAVVFILLATGKQRRILKRQDENKRWYEQRLTELEEERSLHGLSDEEYEYSKQELDKTFVNDSKDIEETIEWRPAPVVLPAVIVVIISVALYWSFGSWQLQEQAADARERLPELGKKLLSEQTQAADPEELNLFALGLRQKLMSDPNDAIAWWIYAGLMVDIGAPEEADEAFQKSLDLEPERLNTLVSYSRFLLMSGSAQNKAKAANLLARALKLNPANIEALSLLGFVAYEQQDWEQAIQAWTLLQQQLSPGSERYVAVQNALADAKQQQANAGMTLTVTVNIDNAVQEFLPEGATLFVYVTGNDAPMPAAVVREPVEGFPVTYTLSNANAMLPDHKLSDLDEWTVRARVSQDENIEAEPGDLEAPTVTIKAKANQTATVALSTRIQE